MLINDSALSTKASYIVQSLLKARSLTFYHLIKSEILAYRGKGHFCDKSCLLP